MINFFKKHKLKIFTAMFCAFALSLFTILSFNCKTYAYTIDNNGNLVGDNLIDCPNYHDFQTSNQWDVLGVGSITDYTSQYTISFTYQQSVSGNGGLFLIQNDTPNAPSVDYPNLGNKLLRTYEYGYVGGNYNVNQLIYSNEITMPYIMLATRSRNSKKVVNLVNVMLNKGDTALDWEPYGVWYSQSNYNEIVNDYDTLENQYNSMISNVEIFSDNISSQSLYFNNTLFSFTDWNYVFVAEKRRLSINTSGLRDIYDGIGPNTNVRYELRLDNSVSALTCYGYVGTQYEITFSIYNSDNTLIFSNSYSSTSGNLADGNFDFGNLVDIKKIIIETTIEDNDYGRDNSFIDFGSDYASGYADGVKENNTYWRGIAEDYDIKINKLNNDINSLKVIINDNTSTINTLKSVNADLQESLNNNVGWQSLFFAMADTPIRTVSNVLGFELFGLNLFSTFIGMVTVFAIVWLLKKFI